jgi:hypothetical protein
VDLINEQDAVGILLQLFQQRFKAFFKIGESGVGKTAIAEGLAWRIVQGDVPEVMADCTIYSTPTAQHLNGALQLFFTADQGIDAANASKLIEVGWGNPASVKPPSPKALPGVLCRAMCRKSWLTAPSGALQLFFTADQGIDAANASKLIEVGGEVFHTFLPAAGGGIRRR